MFGAAPGSNFVGVLFFYFLYPVFFAAFFSWAIWPVTFAYLAAHSPHKRAVKWWLFMPVGSLAASIVGSLKAGFILWVPTLLFFRFHVPELDHFSFSVVFFFVSGGATAIAFSGSWALWMDRELHSGR